MKDANGENHYSVEPFPNDQAEGSWTHRCAFDCGVNEDSVIEIVKWYQENQEPEKNGTNTAMQGVAIEKFARLLVSFEKPPMQNYLLLYALDSIYLDSILERRNATDFGRMFDCTKQAINKALKKIQFELHLPPRKDQRQKISRQKMAQTRKSQLK
jgi:hypothetical protein